MSTSYETATFSYSLAQSPFHSVIDTLLHRVETHYYHFFISPRTSEFVNKMNRKLCKRVRYRNLAAWVRLRKRLTFSFPKCKATLKWSPQDGHLHKTHGHFFIPQGVAGLRGFIVKLACILNIWSMFLQRLQIWPSAWKVYLFSTYINTVNAWISAQDAYSFWVLYGRLF